MAISLNPNVQNNSISNTSGGQFRLVRVVDIIMDDSHKDWLRLGQWDSLGTIFYQDPKSPEAPYNTDPKDTARPFFQHQKFYPLVNEYVLIMSSISKNVYADGDGQETEAYYLPNLNIWNHPHHNALPQSIKVKQQNNSSISSFGIKQAARGLIVRKPKKGDTNIPLGDYFSQKEYIKPLLPYEGDYIIEGRYGNSIRFGSTTLQSSDNSMDSRPFPNHWSLNSLNQIGDNRPKGFEKGQIGDPIIIIRNEQALPSLNPLTKQWTGDTGKGWVPSVEDINKDGATIVMTSNQKVDIEVATDYKNRKSTESDNMGAKSYVTQDTLELKEMGNAILKDVVEDITEIKNEIFEFSQDPGEWLAPTPSVTRTTESIAYDDGDNDFSFYDELLASSSYTEEDFEKYLVDYENTEISGTELSIEEQKEWSDNQSVGERPIDNDEYVTIEDYDTYNGSLNNYSSMGLSGDQKIPLLDTSGKLNKYFEEWKNAEVEYPCLIKNIYNPTGGRDVLINPRGSADIIRQLKSDGINSTGLPRIKFLILHVTATGHQIQHKLARFFLHTKKWSRHGYNLSVSGDGLINYNVDLKDTYSNGSGGNAFQYNAIGGLPAPIENNSSINISWIGTNKAEMFDAGITSSDTTRPNITKAQAHSYERLIKYFVEAFPDIIILGHNQISIGGGSGKSCPCWDPVEYCKVIGVGDNVWEKHLDQYTMEQKKQMNGYDNAAQKDLSNFSGYHGEKYRRTAQYVANLANPELGGDLL